MTAAALYRTLFFEMGPRWFIPKSLPADALYLTFDDGPTQRTAMLSTLLADREMRATFFLLGNHALKNPDIVRQLDDDGHTVGLHGFDHTSAWASSPRATGDDIRRGFDALDRLLPGKIRWFRPPFGHVTPWGLSSATKLGMKTILWDVLSGDYRQGLSAREVSYYVNGRSKAGSVVLLHENGPAWADFNRDMTTFLDRLASAPFAFNGLPV